MVTFHKCDRIERCPTFRLPDVKGASVFIKPNLVCPPTKTELQSVTSYSLIVELCRQTLAAGAREIIVGDGGFVGLWDVYRELWGGKELDAMGIKLVNVRSGEDALPFTLHRIENYISLYGIEVSDYITRSDIIFNVPKLKCHCMARMTGAVKNMMGMMKNKGNMHPSCNVGVLHKRLADLYRFYQPRISYVLMDALTISSYSETSGIPVDAGYLIEGNDSWEVDVAGAHLMGMDPSTIRYLSIIAVESHNKDGEFNRLDLIAPETFKVEDSLLYHSYSSYCG